jgi:hypothetical protein
MKILSSFVLFEQSNQTLHIGTLTISENYALFPQEIIMEKSQSKLFTFQQKERET